VFIVIVSWSSGGIVRGYNNVWWISGGRVNDNIMVLLSSVCIVGLTLLTME
jgi:hypothetical protein